MRNTSYEFCVEALAELAKLDVTYEFVRDRVTISHSGKLIFKFAINNISYHLEYDLKRYDGWEADWCGYFWKPKIDVKIHLGVREATGDDLLLEEFGQNADRERYNLWLKYNPMLKKLFEDMVKLKKKMNYDLIHEMLAVPNLIRIGNLPNHLDKEQFDKIRFNKFHVFYKLDDEELALILLTL